MYQILIKDAKTKQYRFLTVKQEIMREEVSHVTTDLEVRDETVLVGTGEYETVIFQTDDKQKLEEKCVELMSEYNKSQFIPIDNLGYNVDLVWSESVGD